MKKVGVYIHIPFCKQKCLYCDFVSFAQKESMQEEIAKQINKSPRTVKTRMMEMQEKGLIERKNGKRNGEWIVKG